MLNNSFCKNLLFVYFVIKILTIPVIAFADADKIFKDNSKAVVVVVTFDEEGELLSQGSGFIVRADGVIVTNYHVISLAKDIKVKAGDKVLDIEGLIHTDKENDLVILKAKGEKLPVVKFGDATKVNVGEKVYVISSPEGLENTISDGLLSGIREITSDKKVLQITAPISPGSSGGPVFNKDGEVIGIATFLIKEAQNLNFAMPVNLVRDKIGNKKFTAFKESEIEDYKKTAEYWFNLGYYFSEADMYKEAIEAYKQTIKIKPNYTEVYNNLGNTYRKFGMYKEAIEVLNYAIKINPDFPEAHHNLGVVYLLSSMYKEARDAFRESIRINPDLAKPHFGLGIAYFNLNNKSAALEEYKILKTLEPKMANELFDMIYK